MVIRQQHNNHAISIANDLSFRRRAAPVVWNEAGRNSESGDRGVVIERSVKLLRHGHRIA